MRWHWGAIAVANIILAIAHLESRNGFISNRIFKLAQVSPVTEAKPIPEVTGVTGTCLMASATPPFTVEPQCVANDVSLSVSTAATQDGTGTCNRDDDVTVVAQINLQSTATSRYDIGLWINADGVKATSGAACERFAIGVPNRQVLTSNNFDKDDCGDISSSAPYTFEATFTVKCVDINGDNNLDINYCLSWHPKNEYICNGPSAIKPSTKSKCFCAPLPSITIKVVDSTFTVVKAKQPPGGFVSSGDDVTFSFSIQNTATTTATNVFVTDRAADNSNWFTGPYVWTGCSVPPIITPPGFVASTDCWIGSIAAGATVSLTLTVIVNAAPNDYPNVLTLSYDKASSGTRASETSNVVTVTVGSQSYSITKSAVGPSELSAGALTGTFEVVLVNTGSLNVTASFVDVIPAGSTFNAALSDSACAESPAGFVTCPAVTLPSPGQQSYNLAFDIPLTFASEGLLNGACKGDDPTSTVSLLNNGSSECSTAVIPVTWSLSGNVTFGGVPLPGVTVHLCKVACDGTEGACNASNDEDIVAITDAGGEYSFTGLTAYDAADNVCYQVAVVDSELAALNLLTSAFALNIPALGWYVAPRQLDTQGLDFTYICP